MKKLDSQQQARKKLWVKQTGIKERFPARDLSQQEKKEPEERRRPPPTTDAWPAWLAKFFFCACEGFGGEAAIRTDFAARSDLPLLLTASLCQKLCSC